VHLLGSCQFKGSFSRVNLTKMIANYSETFTRESMDTAIALTMIYMIKLGTYRDCFQSTCLNLSMRHLNPVSRQTMSN